MTNGDHHDYHHPVFDTAQDSPIPHTVPPKPMLVAAKRLPELQWVRTSLDPGFEELLHLTRNRFP